MMASLIRYNVVFPFLRSAQCHVYVEHYNIHIWKYLILYERDIKIRLFFGICSAPYRANQPLTCGNIREHIHLQFYG